MPNAGSGAGGQSTAGGGSGPASGGSTAASSGAPLRDACREYARAYCDKSDECNGTNAGSKYCYEASAPACPDLLASPGSTRTAQSLRECALEIAAFSCEQWTRGFLPACSTPGTRVAGEPCVYPSQCQSLSCGGSDSACGTCASLVQAGQACGPGLECAPGLLCSSDSLCIERQAAPTPTPPAPRTLRQLGESCLATECVVGAFCSRPDTSTEGTCEPMPATGQPCAPGVASGPRCAMSDHCDPDGLCAALPGNGEPCAVDSFAARCSAGNYCVAQGGPNGNTCAPHTAAGGACRPALLDLSRADCAEGLACRCANAACSEGTCTPLAREGESCTAESVCEDGTACENGVCEPSDALTAQAVCDAR
jgi:hypothetical protein